MLVTISMKILSKIVSVKKKTTREKIKILSVKRNILSVKKYKTSAREKKKVGVKKTEKSLREKAFPAVKKPEKTLKLVFTGNFYFHGKKKNAASKCSLSIPATPY